MSKNAATELTLGALHAKTAEIMLNALSAYGVAEDMVRQIKSEDAEGNVIVEITVIEPSAALLNAVTKFLKDNEITCQAEESEKLTGLEARLANKKKRSAEVVNLAGLPIREPEELDAPVTSDDDLKALGLG